MHVQDSNIVRSRKRSVEAKNRVSAAIDRIKREKIFDNFTLRKSSQFEFVQQKMIESINENLNEDVTRMLARVDSTFRRRERSRESKELAIEKVEKIEKIEREFERIEKD